MAYNKEIRKKNKNSRTYFTDEKLKELHIKHPLIVKNIADALQKKPNEIISALMSMNILANINQIIDPDTVIKLGKKLGFNIIVDKREKTEHIKHIAHELSEEEEETEDKPEDLIERPPVVAFLGHVDHGKTSLQDAIRKTDIANREAGGITQHIGASVVRFQDKTITFVDTPGHAAFTAMRARGAHVTDIVILVVAADDGFMPQTVEAMNHAKAAKVPIIVAINKIDLPNADPDTVLRQMQENGLMPEDWGGDVGAIRVSAKTGEGIELLLERILLEAEMLELKANLKRKAQAIVLESQLEQGLGATVNIIVKNGTLRCGDAVLCDIYYGKVKALFDDRGVKCDSAGPSMPVKLVGLSGIPESGSPLTVCKNEKEAKKIANEREQEKKLKENIPARNAVNLESLFDKFNQTNQNKVNFILKTDVKGSIEAIVDSLNKLPSDKIKVEFIHTGVGAITGNDVLLAASSDAIIIGFHVRVNPGVNNIAKQENVEIRLYSVIYELIEDIKDALAGRLEPEKREKELGRAKILKIFELSKGPKVCGCIVETGLVRVGAKARVFRDNEIIFNGEVVSLKRFQDDVKEVKTGMECGIRLDNFLDFHENDIIQVYDIEIRKAKL